MFFPGVETYELGLPLMYNLVTLVEQLRVFLFFVAVTDQ